LDSIPNSGWLALWPHFHLLNRKVLTFQGQVKGRFKLFNSQLVLPTFPGSGFLLRLSPNSIIGLLGGGLGYLRKGLNGVKGGYLFQFFFLSNRSYIG